ncbi:MAG: TrkA C-terminal domain-containing protein [Alphaproteobacteria bacterium]|nr:TrkA C-terminal domain-containing protein [Alphaproteobacteria bacterium]
MGSVVALLLILCAVYFIVLFGTVAYQLTGLDWDTAQFQALSAFTGTGFTTRISERVINHPLRRRITLVLILMGYASGATVVATLVSSIALHTPVETAVNITVLVLTVAMAMFLIRRRGLHLRLAGPIRRWLLARMGPDVVPHEELLTYRPGFAISRIEIPQHSRLAGVALRDADLRTFQLQVLAIETNGEVHPVPEADHVLRPGDHVVLYGSVAKVQEAFAPEPPPT